MAGSVALQDMCIACWLDLMQHQPSDRELNPSIGDENWNKRRSASCHRRPDAPAGFDQVSPAPAMTSLRHWLEKRLLALMQNSSPIPYQGARSVEASLNVTTVTRFVSENTAKEILFRMTLGSNSSLDAMPI